MWVILSKPEQSEGASKDQRGSRSIRNKALTSRKLAKIVAKFADDKKAQDIVVLDMRALVNFCDYFVIATGTSDRQVKAVTEAIEEGLGAIGVSAHLARGLKGFSSLPGQQAGPDVAQGAWALLDMGDVVAHVFEPHSREFYALEHLWQDAPRVAYKPGRKKKA